MRLISRNSPASIAAHALLRQMLSVAMKLVSIGVAGFALLSVGQGREATASIILNEREGRAHIRGDVFSKIPPAGPFPEVKHYNVELEPPPGFGPFNFTATPPSNQTRISGATATSKAQSEATITLNTAADTLVVSSAGSMSASASASQSASLERNASGFGSGGFGLEFTTNTPYDYLITSAFSAGGQGNAGAGSIVTLTGSSFFFQRSREFKSAFPNIDSGFSVGTLQPGNYTVSSSASAGAVSDINRPGSPSANADYDFTLQLMPVRPVVRWKNATSGIFQTGGNWTTGAPPSGMDRAAIDLPGTYTVTLSGNAAHSLLDVGGNGANVTLDLDGHRYRLDELRLGDPSGNFSFSLSDSSGIVAVPPGDNGPRPAPGTGEGEITNLTTDGPGRTEISAKTETQTGLIDHSHVVTVQGDGDWKVDRLTVGDQRAATLLISGGGKVDSDFPIIGRRVQGILSNPGKAVVSGGGGLVSKFDAIEMIVGDDGKGELEIKAGGEVTGAEFEVGKSANGQGVVTVDGATASLRQNHSLGDLVIGAQGKGTLNVLNDAVVHTEGNLRIGDSAGGNSDGIVNVTRHGLITAKGLTVGNSGKGALNVLDDGVAGPDRMLIGPKGKVTVADRGILLVDNVLTVNGELSVNTTGTAIVSNAIVPTSSFLGKLTLGPGGTLKGNGIIRANVNFAGGIPQFTGSRLAPANSPGTLTIEGDVVQEPGSAMEIEIGGTSAGQFDVLKVTGDITLGGDLFLKFTDGFAPRQGDQLEFLDVSGMLSSAFANVELRNLAPGFQFDLRRDGGGMTMVAINDGVFMLPPSSAWNVDADGNWSSVANWTLGDPNHPGATAVFGSKTTAPRTVTVDEPITVGRIDFDNSNAYTIAGDSKLTLDATSGDAQINVTGGSHTIGAPVSFPDNTVITVSSAAGNLSNTGALSAADVNLTKAGAGRLTLANLQAGSLTIDQGTVAMAPGGTDASASVLGALSIAGGSTPTAKLDLTGNAAIIDYTGNSPAQTIRQQILAGRGGAGLGAAWNGQGITSSAAAAANAVDAESRSVGYADNSALPLGPYATFHGQPVDDTSLLIAFTRTGDANLDGVVNDDDVTIVGATYAPGVPQPQWALGDFDYNGFVDDDDVTLLGAFYDSSAIPLAVSPPAAATGVAAVPEPNALALLAIGVLALSLLLSRSKAREALQPAISVD